jgi:lysyl-tRNA synthetase class 2
MAWQHPSMHQSDPTGQSAALKSDAAGRIKRRARALQIIREFFFELDFLEVDTPLLVPGPGLEPHIDPLSVEVRPGQDGPAESRFLHTSPELALKRVLAHGPERVFQLSHVFRDGERGPRHLPEFTLLEWYRAHGTLDDLIVDVETLFEVLDVAPDFAGPFRRHTVQSLFEAHADVDLRTALSRMDDGDALALVDAVKSAGHHLRPGADFEDAFFHVMTSRVEPALADSGTHVVESWPKQMAVLARVDVNDPLFAKRFEIYAGGLELANAFDELTDADEQRARFVEDNRHRARLGKAALPLDEAFLQALARMPRAAGIALGVDRLLMLLWGEKDIQNVQSLPWR